LVVKSIKPEKGVHGYRIVEGDVLKMGRGKFRVKEISNTGTFEGNNLEELLVDKDEFEDEESDSEGSGSLSDQSGE
jgi:hypothetical protein